MLEIRNSNTYIKIFLQSLLLLSLTLLVSCGSSTNNLSSEKLLKIGLGKPKSASIIINNIKYRISTVDKNIFSNNNNEIELFFEMTNESEDIFRISRLTEIENENPFLILFLREKSGKLVKKYELNYHRLKEISANKNVLNNNKDFILTKNATKQYLLKIKIPKKAIEKYSLFSLKTRLNFLSKVEKRNLLSIFLKKE